MHKSVIGSYQRSETSCRQINLPVWGGAEEAGIAEETIHLVGPRMRVAGESERRRGGKRVRRRRGKKNNGICCSERSGRERRNWTVDLGNAIRSERKGVYIITGKIRLSLWEDSAHYGSVNSNRRAAESDMPTTLLAKRNNVDGESDIIDACFMKVSFHHFCSAPLFQPLSSCLIFWLLLSKDLQCFLCADNYVSFWTRKISHTKIWFLENECKRKGYISVLEVYIMTFFFF